MNILNRKVLILNKNWQPIGFKAVPDFLSDMNSRRSPKKALKIEYLKMPDGTYDFNQLIEMSPLDFEKWIELYPREHDEDCIRTSKIQVRMPTVGICPHYDKMPFKTFRPTKKNLYERYGGIDYWTGEKLEYNQTSIEHVISKDEWRRKGLQGSPNSWKNVAPCHKKVNHRKSNKCPVEFQKETGFKPHYKLSEPKPVPATLLIKSIISPDWVPFLLHLEK